MPEETQTPDIDLDAIRGEVANMSDDDIRAELLKVRTRQKVQQKKYQSPERQKAYQLKQRERFKLLKEKAIQAGVYDSINAEAEKAAEEKLAELAAENDQGEE